MMSVLAGFSSQKVVRKTDKCLTEIEMSDFIEGHVGSLAGLLTQIYNEQVCPDLISESDKNLLGSFYRIRENGKFCYVDDRKLVEKLFRNFDPKKLVCSQQLRQVQFMTRLISQMLLLMTMAGFQVRKFLSLKYFNIWVLRKKTLYIIYLFRILMNY